MEAYDKNSATNCRIRLLNTKKNVYFLGELQEYSYICTEMSKIQRIVTKTLSLRISLMVVCAIAALLSAALYIMLHYSRQEVKEEALNKASQTLEATVQQIDNILLSVEQSAGNFYWDMMMHMDEPDRMFTYSRKLVETNPYITGAAIAMEPYYYKERGKYFMAYLHRSYEHKADNREEVPLVQSATFGTKPYTEQSWYALPVKTRRPCWVNPLKNMDTEDEALITFSLPIYAKGNKVVGVLAVDVSLTTLSEIVLATKPSPNSYTTLLSNDGSYIVHPDSERVSHHTVFTIGHKDSDRASTMNAVKAMMSGKTGYKRFLKDGKAHYVFYKPFKLSAIPGRSKQELGWSIGIIYPEDDIFEEYNKLLFAVVVITIVSLLLMFLLYRVYTHRRLLPLRMLTKSAQRIAEGHYNDVIPDSRQHDEVGQLQDNFQQMQQALAAHMGELQRASTKLQEQEQVLTTAYEKAKEGDRMKTTFLHNMTNQMVAPMTAINESVEILRNMDSNSVKKEESDRIVDNIQEQGKKIAELLNNLIKLSLT